MLITAAGITHVGEWLSLAREMEPIFGASMADDEQFRQFVSRRIETGEALVALDRMNGNAVMGVIAFSRSGNCVVWLGVFSRYRRRSVGSKLTESAIRQLDAGAEITVVTFSGEDEYAKAARALYERYGFAVTDTSIMHHDQPRWLMTRPAEDAPPRGESFHHKYDRWLRWNHADGCPVCLDEPKPPGFAVIKELEYSWVSTSSEVQGGLYGKCHVLCKKHFVELFEMPREDLLNFMADVQTASRALKEVTGAVKINYEMHGNTVPHLHMHLFPRYIDDSFPGGPIDHRITDPTPYSSAEEFEDFVTSMRASIDGRHSGFGCSAK